MTTPNFKLVATGDKAWLNQSVIRIRIDKRGATTYVDLPRSMQFRPAILRDRLADAGAEFPHEPKAAIKAVLDRVIAKLKSVKEIEFQPSTGWHGKRIFLLPGQTISLKPSNVVFAGVGGDNSVASAGDAEVWNKTIAALVAKSDYVILAIVIALGGPALNILGEAESPIFNAWSEDSSTGKTTLLLLLTSVYGKALRNLLATFELTPRAAEEKAANSNHLSTAIDEMALGGTSLLTPKGKEAFAMMLAGGGGKLRSRAVAASLPNLTWQGTFLTSGNVPAVRGSAKGETSGPTVVRWMDVMVPPRKMGGILNKDVARELDEAQMERNGAFLGVVEETISKNFGHLGPAWIKHLVRCRDGATKRLGELTRQFLQDEVHSKEASELRIGRKWADLAAIAQHAAEQELVPWMPKEGRASIVKLYRRYLRDLGKSPVRHKLAVQKLLKLVESGEGFPSYSTRSLKRKSHEAPESFFGFKIQRPDGTWVLCFDHDQMPALAVKLGLKQDELKDFLRDEELVSLDAAGKITRMQRLPWAPGQPRVRMVVVDMRALRSFLKRQG